MPNSASIARLILAGVLLAVSLSPATTNAAKPPWKAPWYFTAFAKDDNGKQAKAATFVNPLDHTITRAAPYPIGGLITFAPGTDQLVGDPGAQLSKGSLDNKTTKGTLSCMTAPWNAQQVLSCSGGGTLEIEAAFFGKHTGTCTTASLKPDLSCSSSPKDSLKYYQSLCNGKASCKLSYPGLKYWLSCAGTTGKLGIRYRCNNETVAVASVVQTPAVCAASPSTSDAKLSCGNGGKLKIEAAYFGQQIGSCSTLQGSPTCNAAGVLAKVKKACQDKSDCSLSDHKISSTSVLDEGFDSCIKPPTAASQCVKTGSLGPAVLTCGPNAIIEVEEAFYGQQTGSCSAGTLKPVASCNLKDATAKMATECDGKHACEVGKYYEKWSDPCFLKDKTFQARYRCVPLDPCYKLGAFNVIANDDFANGVPNGWAVLNAKAGASSISTCGSLGQVLGGYNGFSDAKATRTLSNMPAHTALKLTFGFLKIDAWKGEEVRILLDNKVIWSKKYSSSGGTQTCGASSGNEQLDMIDVTVPHTAASAKLVFVTDLQTDAATASWGISELQVVATTAGRDLRVPQGWSVENGTLTTSSCGKFGRILGGFGNMAKYGKLNRKLIGLPAHKQLRISFDFIKIDDWSFRSGFLLVDGKIVWSKKYLSYQGAAICGGGGSNAMDKRDPISIVVPHTAATATLTFQSNLGTAATVASWGVDNVKVAAATVGAWGDPCPGKSSQLQVRYSCEKGAKAAQCTGADAEATKTVVQCPAGTRIAIDKALYGLPTGACSELAAGKTCDYAGATAKVKALCNGKASCQVQHYFKLFGTDPCSGVLKRFRLRYSCLPIQPPKPNCALSADYKETKLDCSGKGKILIKKAMYGVVTGTCGGFTAKKNCATTTVLSKVQARCDGEKTCAIGWPHNEFGDSCSGTAKQFAVEYSCVGTVDPFTTGVMGTAFAFGGDGGTNYSWRDIKLPGPLPAISSKGAWTLSLWARVPKSSAFSDQNPLLQTYGVTGASAMTLYVGDKKAGHRIEWANPAGSMPAQRLLRGKTNLADGRWHHIAITFKASSAYRTLPKSLKNTSPTQSGQLAITVDGKVEIEATTIVISSFNAIRLGTVLTNKDTPTVANWRKGHLGSASWIDELFVYGVALGRTQLSRLRAKAKSGLVQVWPPVMASALVKHKSAWQATGKTGAWTTAEVVGQPLQDVSPLRAVASAKGGRVLVPATNDEIGPRTAFTWAGWVRATYKSTRLFALEAGDNTDFAVRLSSGRIFAVVRGTSGGYDTMTAPNAALRMQVNRWTFVAVVYEGHGGKMKFYVDGALIASRDCSFSKVFSKNAVVRTAQLTDGANSQVVWAALFNRALSRDELVRWRSPGPAVWLASEEEGWWNPKNFSWWAADYAGAHVYDSKGVSGQAVYSKSAMAGPTMHFSVKTSRGYVSIPAKGLLDTDHYTMATWITPDVDGEARLMRRMNPDHPKTCGDTELLLMCSKSTCSVEFVGRYTNLPKNYTGGTLYFHRAKFPIPRGKRSHLALVGDDNTIPKLYVNGELVKTSFGGYRAGKCTFWNTNGRDSVWRIGYHNYWGSWNFDAGKTGSLKFESARIYARKLSPIEISHLASSCADLGCSSRTCVAGSGANKTDVTAMCGRCRGNYYEHNDQLGDSCVRRLRMHAKCTDDEQCSSGTCLSVSGRCVFKSDRTSCDLLCPQLRRTCVKVANDGAGLGIKFWGCGGCLAHHEAPTVGADVSKIACLWKPTLDGGERCDSEFQCRSGVCRLRKQEVYQPWTASKPRLRNSGGVLTMRRVRPGLSQLQNRKVCAYQRSEKCTALHRYSAQNYSKSPTASDFDRSYTKCGPCTKNYHRAWSLLSPIGCVNLYLQAWINQWKWTSQPTYSQFPSLQELKLLALNQTAPFTVKDFYPMEKKGIGPYMWRVALTSQADKLALNQKWGFHSLDSCFSYDTCWGGATCGGNDKKNTDGPYFNRQYNHPICVATRYPNGSKCPPLGEPAGTNGHQFCQSGYCSRDNGVCADGGGATYEYSGKSRKDNKKGKQSALFSMTQENATDVSITDAAKGKLIPKPMKRKINSSSKGDFYLIGKDFPVYYLDPVVRCDESKKKEGCKVHVAFKVMGFTFPVTPSPVSQCAGGKVNDKGVVDSPAGCSFDPKNFGAQPAATLCVPVVDFVNKRLLLSKSGLSQCPKIGACEKCPLSISCEWQAGVVPVKAEAGPVLDVCFGFGLTLSQQGELMFKIEPKVGVGAEIKAGVGKDFGIASVFVGIKAAITAISLAMPIGWSTVVGSELLKNGVAIPNLFKVTTHQKVTLEIQILGLSISIFAELGVGPFSFTVDATLLNYTGISLSFVLSDKELSKKYLDFEVSDDYLKSLLGK